MHECELERRSGVERSPGRHHTSPRSSGPLDHLTKRQREVLSLIAEGRSNAGVAEELVIMVAAVERHMTSIFDKLGRNHVSISGACSTYSPISRRIGMHLGLTQTPVQLAPRSKCSPQH